MTCSVPPPGWRCTRDEGHDGPCAAVASAGPIDPALLDTLCRWYHGVRNDQARDVLVDAGLVLHFDSPYGDEITERGAQVLANALRLSQLRCAWLETCVAFEKAQAQSEWMNEHGAMSAQQKAGEALWSARETKDLAWKAYVAAGGVL